MAVVVTVVGKVIKSRKALEFSTLQEDRSLEMSPMFARNVKDFDDDDDLW